MEFDLAIPLPKLYGAKRCHILRLDVSCRNRTGVRTRSCIKAARFHSSSKWTAPLPRMGVQNPHREQQHGRRYTYECFRCEGHFFGRAFLLEWSISPHKHIRNIGHSPYSRRSGPRTDSVRHDASKRLVVELARPRPPPGRSQRNTTSTYALRQAKTRLALRRRYRPR